MDYFALLWAFVLIFLAGIVILERRIQERSTEKFKADISNLHDRLNGLKKLHISENEWLFEYFKETFLYAKKNAYSISAFSLYRLNGWFMVKGRKEKVVRLEEHLEENLKGNDILNSLHDEYHDVLLRYLESQCWILGRRNFSLKKITQWKNPLLRSISFPFESISSKSTVAPQAEKTTPWKNMLSKPFPSIAQRDIFAAWQFSTSNKEKAVSADVHALVSEGKSHSDTPKNDTQVSERESTTTEYPIDREQTTVLCPSKAPHYTYSLQSLLKKQRWGLPV